MMLADTGRDLRQALRTLATAPGFALGVIASLTLGIVANTAAFSFINAAVFRPFPGVRDQHELVRVNFARPLRGGTDVASTYAEYEALAAGLPSLEALSAHVRVDLALAIDGDPMAAAGAVVSPNYFEILGVRPSAGRFFLPSDGHAPVVVISHDLWRRRFNEQPSVVGTLLLLNGATVEVVGVAAPRFHTVQKGGFDIDVWLPPQLSSLALRDQNRRPVSLSGAGFRVFTYVGRRRSDATIAAVQGQADTVAKSLDGARPADRRGIRIAVERVWLNDPARNITAVIAFMAVPLLVLIIASVNAGNLLLARASRQTREWQVRLALGASAWRIVRQVLIECVVLALLASAASLMVTAWALALLAGTVPVPMPLDVRVLLFTVAVTVTAALAFGLGPAVRVVRRGTSGVQGLRAGESPARSRVRSLLIGLQAAVSLGLLATGGQFVTTARSGFGAEQPPGAERLLIATFDLDPLNVAQEATDAFYTRLATDAASLDGVVAAGVTTASTLAGTFNSNASIRVWLPGDSRPDGGSGLAPVVSGRYFQAIGVPLVAGRYFTSGEEQGRPRTAIINEAFSRLYLGSKGPGLSLRVAAARAAGPTMDVQIVGVVGSERTSRRDTALIYLPAPITASPARSLYVRFDDTGRFTVANLHEAVRKIDARVPIRRAATLRDQQGDSDTEQRLFAGGVALLGVFALALAAGGIYGVVSYLVALRRREIGIRLALGATSASVVRLIVRQGLVPAGIGALLGAGAAAALGMFVRSRLYGASPVDPAIFAGAAAVLSAALLAACILPARHAAHVDPVIVLRDE